MMLVQVAARLLCCRRAVKRSPKRQQALNTSARKFSITLASFSKHSNSCCILTIRSCDRPSIGLARRATRSSGLVASKRASAKILEKFPVETMNSAASTCRVGLILSKILRASVVIGLSFKSWARGFRTALTEHCSVDPLDALG